MPERCLCGHLIFDLIFSVRLGILADIRLAGYKRRDVWRNDGKPIQIPFVEGGADAFYFGCCFDRVSA